MWYLYNINFKKRRGKNTAMQANLRSNIGLLGERVFYVTVGMLHRPISIQESVLYSAQQHVMR